MKRRAPWIACVGPVSFPWGEAGSRRIFGLVASLASAGYHVVVAGGDAEPRTETVLPGIDGPGSVSYLGLAEKPAPGVGVLASSAQMLLRWGRRTVRWLEDQPTKPSHVLVHSGQAQYMVHLQRWCHSNRVPLIVDVVDWYDGRRVRGGYFGPLHISMKLALRYYYPRCDGIIAISTYLERYYRRSAMPVVRVPPTLDVKGIAEGARHTPDNSSNLVLVYAGNPNGNRKDLLSTVIEAVGRVEREGASIELRVYGPREEDMRQLANGHAMPAGVHCLGRVPQDEVASALREADFSILIRRPELAANAGFSTKFCESLANGTPVIANLTSDMGQYLQDGRQGMICRDHTLDEVTNVVRAAAQLTPAQKGLMRLAAQSTALESFDYRSHADSLGEFFRNWD